MTEQGVVPVERIEGAILTLRGHRVLLDADLAALYGVETKRLNRAVKRNSERFPDDFLFQLTEEEAAALRFHSGTSNGRGGRRYLPYAFTEQGVARCCTMRSGTEAYPAIGDSSRRRSGLTPTPAVCLNCRGKPRPTTLGRLNYG